MLRRKLHGQLRQQRRTPEVRQVDRNLTRTQVQWVHRRLGQRKWRKSMLRRKLYGQLRQQRRTPEVRSVDHNLTRTQVQ